MIPIGLLLKEIRHNPLLWLLAFVPVVVVAAKLEPEAHKLLLVLLMLAIVSQAAIPPALSVGMALPRWTCSSGRAPRS